MSAIALQNEYRLLRLCCRIVRITEQHTFVSRIGYRLVQKSNSLTPFDSIRKIGRNKLLAQFRDTRESNRCVARFLKSRLADRVRVRVTKKNTSVDRQGNLIVLKKYDANASEKGVLYLHFTESIKVFATLFDLDKIAKKYRLVVGPSTWGYFEESFHLLVGSDFDVVVQAQDKRDYEVIDRMDCNLIPIRLGSGDWVDPTRFVIGQEERQYDLVMVASWLRLKGHELLFRSVRDVPEVRKIALIGYEWQGRRRSHIEQEARKHGVLDRLVFFESIPHEQVARILGESKISVMLSLREGANKGIYEALFCDTPVIILEQNRGVNRQIINDQTGAIATATGLGDTIRDMLERRESMQPAQWADRNTGYKNAHQKLNSLLSNMASANGETFRVPIAPIRSAPLMQYAHTEDRLAMESEYGRLECYLNNPVVDNVN